MNALLRLLAVSSMLLVGGCGGSMVVRITHPRGAVLRFENAEGDAVAVRTGRTMRLELGYYIMPYEIELEVPAALAATYGVNRPVVLAGHFYVGPNTDLTRNATVEFEISEARFASLVRGEVREIEESYIDPYARRRVLKIVLQVRER